MRGTHLALERVHPTRRTTMKTLLLAALIFAPALAIAKPAPSLKTIKADIAKAVGTFGKTTVRGNTWKLQVANGPVFRDHGRALELKAKGTVNRLTGKVHISYENHDVGTAL
jgi:hypothetical protein